MTTPGVLDVSQANLCTKAVHTENNHEYQIFAFSGAYYIWPSTNEEEPHVCYKSTQNGSDVCWLRPLSMFTDKRFTLVS